MACELTVPTQDVHWTKDGKQLVVTEQRQVIAKGECVLWQPNRVYGTGTAHAVHLRPAAMDDAGTYVLEITGTKNRSETELIVKGEKTPRSYS
jgi:hypothetical protein